MKRNKLIKVLGPLLILVLTLPIFLLAACGQASTTTNTTSETSTSSITSISTGTTTSTMVMPSTTLPPIVTINIVPPTMAAQVTVNLPAFDYSHQYVVFTWNDLGMHCANPSYDTAVLLPPYNNLWAQVVKRGNPPQVVTLGINVEYEVVDNTYSYGKGQYAGFWDNIQKLFGASLQKNTGLNLDDPNVHNSMKGTMAVKSDHFVAFGIPLTPYYDNGGWNPYQIGHVTVKDSGGNVLAETYSTIPISDEIACAKCHGTNAFQDILQKHDALNGTKLTSQEPVLCDACHGDPALGKPDPGPFHYLSDHIHGFHSTVNPQPACYDCHPGQTTQCSRSLAHTATDGNCTTCHGDLANVSSSIDGGRTPWATEPKCATCHSGVAEVDTQTALYRNATGHGGVYCASCHGSPHAMVPTSLQSDSFQPLEYQGKAMTISDCRVCHRSSRGGGEGGETGEFTEVHGGSNPQVQNACFICHTSLSSDATKWPHMFQWKAR